jgi:hypothetical protein
VRGADPARNVEQDPSDAAESAIHLVVKWSARYEPTTITQHRQVVDEHGAVWWAVFTQSEQWQLSSQWLAQFEAQLAAAEETFVFIAGDTCWRTRLVPGRERSQPGRRRADPFRGTSRERDSDSRRGTEVGSFGFDGRT